MWLTKKLTGGGAPETAADLGVTTIPGGSAGVLARGEVRDLPVYGPTGLCWQPRNGDTVLLVKGGTGGEESCVAGAEQQGAPADLRPGELYLHAGGASLWLRNDGSVHLEGEFYINGVRYEPPEEK